MNQKNKELTTNHTHDSTDNGVVKTKIMNELTGRVDKSKSFYLDVYLASLNEANKLLNESKLLFENKSYERSYFLGFSALEEISKSQIAADVYTGFTDEKIFKKVYRDHLEKISRVKWIQLDGDLFPNFVSEKIKDFNYQKKLKSLYVNIDFSSRKISRPSDSVTENDAENIIKAVEVGLYRIYEITELWGEQIGTKGFMK